MVSEEDGSLQERQRAELPHQVTLLGGRLGSESRSFTLLQEALVPLPRASRLL